MKSENDLDVLIETFFDEFYYYFSSFATPRGIHRYDYKLSSYGKEDLNNLKNFVNDIQSTLRNYEERNKNQRQNDTRTFYRFLENLSNFIDKGIYNSPQYFLYDAFVGLTTAALTQSKPISIRSRNFTERLSSLKTTNDYVRNYVTEISEIERKAILKEIDYLELFINQFSSYLLTKSDTDKKENLKLEKTNAIASLNELRKTVKSMRTGNNVSIKGYIDFNNLDNSFVDLRKILEESLKALSENIIRKAREIKIASPYRETLEETLLRREKFDDGNSLNLVNSIENSIKKFLPFENISFEKRIFLEPSDFPDIMLGVLGYSLSSGEFDNKKSVFIIIKNEMNPSNLMYSLISNVFFSPVIANFYRQGIKSKKKYFLNLPLYFGFPLYLKRVYFDEFKTYFDRAFELIYYYEEYVLTLKAFLQNEIYFRNWDLIAIENFINEDKILIDKEKFMENFIYDLGRSFLAIEGLIAIHDLRKERKLKTSDFNLKLLQNMHYPFSIIRQILR